MRFSKIYSVLGALAILLGSISFATIPVINDPTTAVLLTKQGVFSAGTAIPLDFELSKMVKTQLFVHSSYGSTLLDSENGHFELPAHIATKSGTIDFSLWYKKELLDKGFVTVIPNAETSVRLTSYIGPPSISAGGKDYAMQVVVATDTYDNPLPDSTAIVIKEQFQELQKETTVYSKDLLGWINHYSYNRSGRILLASEVENTASKEFTVDIYPAIATNFDIQSSRKHAYADGNQITTLTTSIIRDAYKNRISDGTLVQFVIGDTNGNTFHTQGSTIRGVATANILHPDHADTWQIKAYILGIAESNVLQLKYKAVLDDFPVNLTANNRKITVGPILSFMGQLIPDGAAVTLKVFQNDSLLSRRTKTSFNGLVSFTLKNGSYPSGDYLVQLETLGIQKTPISIVLP